VGLDVGSERRGVTGGNQCGACGAELLAYYEVDKQGGGDEIAEAGELPLLLLRRHLLAAALASRGGFESITNRVVGIDRNFADMGNPVAVGCDIQRQWWGNPAAAGGKRPDGRAATPTVAGPARRCGRLVAAEENFFGFFDRQHYNFHTVTIA